MAINHTTKAILKALSFDGIEVEASRHLADLKRIDPLKIFYKKIDYKVYNGEHEVPVRIFFPNEKAYENESLGEREHKVMLFFHGGGWATDSIDNYERICARLANATDHLVIAVEYRLAPEYKFPCALEDCYAVARKVYQDIDSEDITLIGDSAGGNLTAALSLLARDRKEFAPQRQILIYPAVNSDYSEKSPFVSVKENGTDYLLTAGKMRDYISLYASSKEDLTNPYFAPIYAKDLSAQPKTLVITAEYDPLRDEGEAYAQKLKDAGNYVEVERIKDALHGYFALGIKNLHVKESFDIMNGFLHRTQN